MGSYLSRSDAAFDPRDYGHAKLGELMRSQSFIEVESDPAAGGRLRVRLKQ